MEIETRIKEFKGVKLIFEYIMKNVKNGEVVLEATSKHCFVNEKNKPIILKKEFPELDKVLKSFVES